MLGFRVTPTYVPVRIFILGYPDFLWVKGHSFQGAELLILLESLYGKAFFTFFRMMRKKCSAIIFHRKKLRFSTP
jgi:hypothetical protein